MRPSVIPDEWHECLLKSLQNSIKRSINWHLSFLSVIIQSTIKLPLMSRQLKIIFVRPGAEYYLMADWVRGSNLIAGPELPNLLYLKALDRLLPRSCSFTSTASPGTGSRLKWIWLSPVKERSLVRSAISIISTSAQLLGWFIRTNFEKLDLIVSDGFFSNLNLTELTISSTFMNNFLLSSNTKLELEFYNENR